MATQIPPPARKKAKLEAQAANTVAPAPIELPNVVAQFRDANTGKLFGPSVTLPGGTDKRGLELLVNQLKATPAEDDDDGDRPWSFSLLVKDADGESRLPIHTGLTDIASKVSPEDVLVIECEPEAIFRVRAVQRCSSSISGPLALHFG